MSLLIVTAVAFLYATCTTQVSQKLLGIYPAIKS